MNLLNKIIELHLVCQLVYNKMTVTFSKSQLCTMSKNLGIKGSGGGQCSLCSKHFCAV